MDLQRFLDMFDDKFLTIDVYENTRNGYFTFNTFDIVPVKCDINFFWDEMEVEDEFCIDSISLDTSDNTITFLLGNRTKEMINVKDIISLNVSKISKSQYLQAVKDDEDFFKFLT